MRRRQRRNRNLKTSPENFTNIQTDYQTVREPTQFNQDNIFSDIELIQASILEEPAIITDDEDAEFISESAMINDLSNK